MFTESVINEKSTLKVTIFPRNTSQFYKMQRPIPLKTLVRFPIVFGSFMIACGVGFYHRKSWLGDNEEYHKSIITDATGAEMINSIKQKHREYSQTH